MSYVYEDRRGRVFSEELQPMFLAIRDAARDHIAKAGAVTSGRLMVVTGDTWDMLACIDRLVELGDLREIPNIFSAAGQHRVFIGRNQ